MDQRIFVVNYAPDEVYKYTGHYGFQSSIEFEEGEQIETISMGDSVPWMINPLNNRIFLKPVQGNAETNMTVITDRRVYHFELHAKDPETINDEGLIFVMRFLYPTDSMADFSDGFETDFDFDRMMKEKGSELNFNYTLQGSQEIAPIRIFDDGEFTYFEFRDKNAEVPAFYFVKDNGEEAMLNFRTRGDFIIVERVAKRYTLRSENDIVCVYNEGPAFGEVFTGVDASTKQPPAAAPKPAAPDIMNPYDQYPTEPVEGS